MQQLDKEEFEIMKTHTIMGAKILEQIPDLHSVIPIVRSHHERWDGLGYPDGLKGDKIHRLARIVAVADTFDAMTSDSPYRRGLAPEVAFAEIDKFKGEQFDPECAAAFLSIHQRILQQMQAASLNAANMDRLAERELRCRGLEEQPPPDEPRIVGPSNEHSTSGTAASGETSFFVSGLSVGRNRASHFLTTTQSMR